LPLLLGSFSLVAVFPPTRYPSTCPFFPVPSATTASNTSLNVCDVSFETAPTFSLYSYSVISFVTGFFFSKAKCGVTSLPPLIPALTARISCSGVICIDCPKDIVASSTAPILSSLCIMEFASPGRSTPVLS